MPATVVVTHTLEIPDDTIADILDSLGATDESEDEQAETISEWVADQSNSAITDFTDGSPQIDVTLS
jgi:hypothetical protein